MVQRIPHQPSVRNYSGMLQEISGSSGFYRRHAQVIGPIEIGKNSKVGAAAVVVADVPEDVTVVGVPAKVVRVHGQKDEEVIHDIEEGREYYSEKLEDLLKAASFHSSRL